MSMTITNIIGIALMVLFGALVLYILITVTKIFMMIHVRRCKYCNHVLEFKNCKEDDNGSYYEYHCPHCGAWEKVSKKEMFKEESVQ